METSTPGLPQTSQGPGTMPASAQTNYGRNSDAKSGKTKIRNFCLGENGQWKLRSEMLSHSELEKYTKKIIWDESISLKDDEDFARHLLESLEEDLGYRDKFTSQKKNDRDEKTKKTELQTMFPHEAERWETLRDRVVSLPYFDCYLQKNPDWKVDELFGSCLMDRLEEQLNNSNDWQNFNKTTLEEVTSRDNADMEKEQEDDEDDIEDVNEDDSSEDEEDGDSKEDLGEDEDKNDEDWVVDNEDKDSEDDDESDTDSDVVLVDIHHDDSDVVLVDDDHDDSDVVSVCDDPKDSDLEVYKPRCSRKTRQDSRPVLQHKHVSSSDRDKTEEELEKEKEETMTAEKTETDGKTVTKSKQTMFECKICREVFRTRFLVTHHFTTKHQRHVHRSMSKECSTLLRHCEECGSYVSGLKEHKLQNHQVCQNCRRIYSSIEKLRRHTESHTNPDSPLVRPKQKVYECNICKQHFGAERHVIQHVSTKHKNCKTMNSVQKKSGTVLQTMKVGDCATVLWYCKECDSYVDKLKSHRQEKHQFVEVSRKTSKSLMGRYSDKRCKIKWQFNYRIKTHVKKIKKSHTCGICSKHFWRLQNLAFHMKQIHSHGKTFLCSYCGLFVFLSENTEKHKCVCAGAELYNV
ncbi:zinc finger protein 652-B-like [Asterias rubens]|uniref:zinc finger protein 652-B-like n=1 Tax=Asterias rubens TaxID=7604 RepID=UPI001455B138|nr:zinc finger protein 652-B-like [Asterias rubens]